MHWFNPNVYIWAKKINQFCEFACDEQSVQNLSEKEHYEYGRTLIEMKERAGNYHEKIGPVALYEYKSELKERLYYLTTSYERAQLTPSLWISAVLLLFLFGWLLGNV